MLEKVRDCVRGPRWWCDQPFADSCIHHWLDSISFPFHELNQTCVKEKHRSFNTMPNSDITLALLYIYIGYGCLFTTMTSIDYCKSM